MSMKNRLTLGPFTAGVISGLAAYSLFMDYHGLEEWIEHCRNNWITGYITVPLAIIALVWGHWSYYHHREIKEVSGAD